MNALDAYGAALDAAESVGVETLTPADARPIFEAALDAIPSEIDDADAASWLYCHGVTSMLVPLLVSAAGERADGADVKGIAASLADLGDRLATPLLRTGAGRALEGMTTLAVALGGWSPY